MTATECTPKSSNQLQVGISLHKNNHLFYTTTPHYKLFSGRHNVSMFLLDTNCGDNKRAGFSCLFKDGYSKSLHVHYSDLQVFSTAINDFEETFAMNLESFLHMFIFLC